MQEIDREANKRFRENGGDQSEKAYNDTFFKHWRVTNYDVRKCKMIIFFANTLGVTDLHETQGLLESWLAQDGGPVLKWAMPTEADPLFRVIVCTEFGRAMLKAFGSKLSMMDSTLINRCSALSKALLACTSARL